MLIKNCTYRNRLTNNWKAGLVPLFGFFHTSVLILIILKFNSSYNYEKLAYTGLSESFEEDG